MFSPTCSFEPDRLHGSVGFLASRQYYGFSRLHENPLLIICEAMAMRCVGFLASREHS